MGRSTTTKNQVLDINADLDIDHDNLDTEWIKLPQAIAKYGRLHSQAEKQARDLEEEVKTIRSELVLNINNNPEEFGLAKVTGVLLEASYRQNERYQYIKQKLNKALYEVDSLKSVIFGLSAKRAALENLTKLLSMEYFSESAQSRDLSGSDKQKTRAEIKQALNKKEK